MSFAESKFQDDTDFNSIERDYLTLADNDCTRNSKLLKAIVEEKLIPLMKRNTLFEEIFNRVAFGGSYYKGTKYGSPDEFDLYLVHKFNKCKADLKINSSHNHFGYVKIKMNYELCDRQVPYEEELKKITHFNDENKFLDQNKFRAWLEGVFIKALGTLSRDPYHGYGLHHDGRTYYISHKKSGPALTIMVRHPSGSKLFDVDLVPAIEFDGIHLHSGYWVPPAARRQNTTHTVNAKSTTNSTEHKRKKKRNFGYKRYNDNKLPFMVVPKPLNKSISTDNLYWRLCFFENEKAMLRGEVKSVIKMIKKFRDTQEMKSIKSYFIETIFYHELENHKNNLEEFLRHSKTQLLIHGLRKLREALENGKLPYFWNERLDLFQKMSWNELDNHANRLGSILKDIEENIENDRLVLKKHICGTS
ncbi:uncharacterized protein LOC106659695 [Trichogramma pretiosum]|uniref:uncharacterized protein LOC106659695 n=1 Tax=Trichogramma pretiosum TaxID=7493 RepID=UPI000C71C2AE|nr:uncharacterized protein LOC106659695 [Trichogramma pretiosum]